MSQGFVKLFRKTLDNPNASNPLWLATWNYLLLRATHKPYTMRIGGENRVLNPGQLITSCRKIANFFEVGKDTINRILSIMEADNMLRRENCNRKTIYTVLNWSSYQVQSDTNGDTSEDTSGDTNGDTNKKREERRKLECKKKPKPASTETEKITPLAREILLEFNERADKSYKSDSNLKEIRGRLREGRTKEEMILVIDHKVRELKGTENEGKWLTPIGIFRESNFDRNLEWAKNWKGIELARLQKEYEAAYRQDPLMAKGIRAKMNEIRNNGKLEESGS